MHYLILFILMQFNNKSIRKIYFQEEPDSRQEISLVYTNSDEYSHSEEIAKFQVPNSTKKWTKIVIRISTSEVAFHLNCYEIARKKVTRIPQELVFDTASTLYIAQAGPHIQEKYDVSNNLFLFVDRNFFTNFCLWLQYSQLSYFMS